MRFESPAAWLFSTKFHRARDAKILVPRCCFAAPEAGTGTGARRAAGLRAVVLGAGMPVPKSSSRFTFAGGAWGAKIYCLKIKPVWLAGVRGILPQPAQGSREGPGYAPTPRHQTA